MACLMVLDHLSLLSSLLDSRLLLVFHLLSRCVAVWFAYTAVEGFIHTSRVGAYLKRLFLAAVLMSVGNGLLNLLLASKGIYVSYNIFWTLACGVLLLQLIWGSSQAGFLRARLVRYGCIGVVFVGACLVTEGGFLLIPFMLVTYGLRQKERLRTLVYLFMSLALLGLSFQMYSSLSETLLMLSYNSDWFFISFLPLLSLYNGQRGPSTAFSKYFFYIFYPAHIWLLALLAYFLV